MILSDSDIRTALIDRQLIVSGWRQEDIQPASIDLRLGLGFKSCVRSNIVSDLAVGQAPDFDVSDGRELTIFPGDFCLATTEATVGIPEWMVARVEGKSTLGRAGLLVHVTAGFIDPGFSGQITLELKNVSGAPLLLTAGMYICQLSFQQLTSVADRPYGSAELGSKYQGQTGPTVGRPAS